MFEYSFVRSYLSLFLMASLFFTGMLFFALPEAQHRSNYIAPPLEIKYLTAGFDSSAADSFWLRAVQDFDYCDHPLKNTECQGKSWLFDVVNLVVELDNHFKEAYFYGGLALTVIISDYEGASVIFDKGVKIFNKDWQLLYTAGYHALFEEHNKLKASRLYLAAVENGAPEWVRLTAGRLASEGGDEESAKEILKHLIELQSDPAWINKLQSKINEMSRKSQ